MVLLLHFSNKVAHVAIQSNITTFESYSYLQSGKKRHYLIPSYSVDFKPFHRLCHGVLALWSAYRQDVLTGLAFPPGG